VPPLILPIFPLPDVTFFPNTLLPLHVFEARYRAMVMDVLARDRQLAVVKLAPGFEAAYAGKPAVHPVAEPARS
jgi:Lon protease-like protein